MPVTQSWLQRPERGSPILIRFMVWLARVGMRPVARALLYPISLYFVVFTPIARAASFDFLRQVLGRRAKIREVWRHYHCFAAALLDRVFFLTDTFDSYEIRVHGLEALLEHVDQGRGCILLGGHLGSFEVSRSIARHHSSVRLKILMYQKNARRIGKVVMGLNRDASKNVIDIDSPLAMLEVKDWIDAGGVVGILADRSVHQDRTFPVQFLGKEAWIPAGPFRLAEMTGAPVFAFCGVYRRNRRYDVKFLQLTDRVDRPPRGSDRELHIRSLAQAFANVLEDWVRDAPYNWFNFYDFWAPPAPGRGPRDQDPA